jgi:DNA-3-methyladenine glycosylase II
VRTRATATSRTGTPANKKGGSAVVAKNSPDQSIPSQNGKAASSRTKPATARVRSYHPGPLVLTEAVLKAAVAGLLRHDPKIIGAMLRVGGQPPLRKGQSGFCGLASIIVSQQVSVASANAIFARLTATIVPLEAGVIVTAPDAQLQACGLSRPKIRTLKAVAATIESGALSLDRLAKMSPEAAHSELVAIHGIGPWTADIFLLFCLGHPDAWPAGDLALQEAARIILKLTARPAIQAMQTIGERWRPWRGVAARILWTYYRRIKSRAGIVM